MGIALDCVFCIHIRFGTFLDGALQAIPGSNFAELVTTLFRINALSGSDLLMNEHIRQQLQASNAQGYCLLDPCRSP